MRERRETKSEFQLYVDDSGTRNLDHDLASVRRDSMNHFALGGILVAASDIDAIYSAHTAFCRRWKIDYPLHSARIRGRRGKFGWLAENPQIEKDFLADLQSFILSLPIICLSVTVDRAGYLARYKEAYPERLWLMCKTAFSILAERAAKFVRTRNARLEIYFEQSGKTEDRNLRAYARSLKSEGMPFDQERSATYEAMTAADFRGLIVGEPVGRTKKTPMVQVADLVLYPMAKAGYDPTYPPYRALFDGGKSIDSLLTEQQRPTLGLKYSCFDHFKRQDPAEAGS